MGEQPPPPYTRPAPHVDILFLGSPGVGKATFLSRLEHTRHHTQSPSTIPLPSKVLPPPHSLSFDVTLFARPYHFHIYTSTSTLFVDPFPPEPAFTIIAFDIADRNTLHNAQFYWRKQLSLHYDNLEHSMPVMLLGLKRDKRHHGRLPPSSDTSTPTSAPAPAAMQPVYINRDARGGYGGFVAAAQPGDGENDNSMGQFVCVMPQEGLRAAQEMRCDRYAECSALTGELMWEVLEDVTRTAAKTTTEAGGLAEGASCAVM